MARIYAHKKGASGSKKPYRISAPGWAKHSPEEVESLVLKLNKEGLKTPQIGAFLRDTYGIPSVKLVTQKRISKILKGKGVKIEIPEDLFSLMKRAVLLRKHLASHHKDLHSRAGLDEIEMKIWRLLKYYKKTKVLPEGWKYTPETAALIVSGG